MADLQAPTTTKQTTKVKNLIQETTDYSIFKDLPHNRPLVQSHVIRLARSMADRPHLRPARPVLLNDKYQVIDGQHRIGGSEINEQSVFFMVVPGLTIDDARLLNALQRTWSILDYGYSYASSKVPAYVQFVKTYESRQLPPSVIVEFMGESDTRNRNRFRMGELPIADQKKLDAELDELEDILAEFPKTATSYVVSMAFRVVRRTEGYDHARMLEKIRKAKVETRSNRIDYIRELERAYNMDTPFNGPSYLRFF